MANTLDYVPRHPSAGVLHRIVRTHLTTFLDSARTGDDAGLPRFVEKEFRDFLGCGVLGRGFARFRCADCAFERLVPFSCKRRGVCPSCGGRRMTALAAHLVDAVLPVVPVRQWVLTLPYRLRYLLAWDHKLCRAVLAVYIRALLGFQRRQAKKTGCADGYGGAVTVIQRFGSALNINVHFHVLLLDGVFAAGDGGPLHFHPAAPPTDTDVARLLGTIRTRIVRLLCRRGIMGEDTDPAAVDPLDTAAPALASIIGASVQGRTALGPHAGRRVVRLGRDADAPWVTSTAPRQAHLDGFDLHGNLALPAGARRQLERVCRYLLRPAVAEDRLELAPQGQVLLHLRHRWTDGTTHLLFEASELLEKLAALTPRPRINLLLYHGVLAPRARWRRRVAAYGRTTGPATLPTEAVSTPPQAGSGQPAEGKTGTARDGAAPARARAPAVTATERHWTWAALMRRAFAFDVLACPRCGGRMRLIATIEDPAVIRKILRHLGLSTEVPEPLPARSPPGGDPGPDDLAF